MSSRGERSLRELVRPYYLKWLYFRLSRQHEPDYFRAWRRFPSWPLHDLPNAAAGPPSELPDIVWLPMGDWHTTIQRTQHLATGMARLGHRCVYVNPHLGREFARPWPFGPGVVVSQLGERILELHIRLRREPVFHHRALEEGESRQVAQAIESLLERLGTRNAAILCSFPLWTDAIRILAEGRGWPVLYDCHDLLEGFGDIAPSLLKREVSLFERATAVSFSAQPLRDLWTDRIPALASKAAVVRNAVDLEHFPLAEAPAAGPVVIGYAGALHHWFEVEVVEHAAARHPEWQFELIGRVDAPEVRRLERLPNVRVAGAVPYAELPARLARFHAAIIPFRMSALIRSVDPVKLYEYLASGLPVVSSPLPEVERFGSHVRMYRGPDEFTTCLEGAVGDNGADARQARRTAVSGETWDARAAALLALL